MANALWIDAPYVNVRASGASFPWPLYWPCNTGGACEILGLATGPSKAQPL
jgi:hypothetical protein